MTINPAPRQALVAIPALNEINHIEAVLDSLSQDLPKNINIIFAVVDGGSTDGTAALVLSLARSRPTLKLLHNPKRIQSVAMNLAVARLGRDADVFIRCDAHAIYPAGYIARLLDTLDRSGADSVVVPMDCVGRTCIERAVGWVSDTPIGSGGSAHRGGMRSGFVDHGHHAAFRMASFHRAGGYDESFTHNEDAELDCRQRALGGRIYLDAEIRLGYHPRNTLGGLWRQYFSYGRGRARTVRRHPGSMRARQFVVPVHVGLTALALSVAPWSPVLLAWPVLYIAVLALVSVALAVAHRSACGLLTGLAAGVMHTGWALGFFWSLMSIREPTWTPPHGATAKGST